jgi:hypothetical protein
MRAAALEAIAETGGGMVWHADSGAVTKALEKQTGAVEKGRVGGFVSHDRITGSVEVNLDGGSETDAKNPEKAQGIYSHELGHAIDAGRRFSEDAKWKAAWKSEIFNGRVMLSRYARESPTEGFAEFHRALCFKGLPATMAAYPKCCAFLKAKGLI